MQNYDPNALPIGIEDVLGALPPPADWNEVAKAIAARPPPKEAAETFDLGLRLLSGALTGDAEARKREVANIQAKAKDADTQMAYFYINLLQQLSQPMMALSDDPEAVLKSLERQLDPARGRGNPILNLPNLVADVGAEKAVVFLRKALTQSDAQLMFGAPNETSVLAQKLALELIDQLKVPQWGLVNSLDAVDLYEAMNKRFGKETNESVSMPSVPAYGVVTADGDIPDPMRSSLKPTANIYYMLGLIAKDRSKDAVVLAKKIGGQRMDFGLDNAFKAMEHAGYTAALDNFFFALLTENPALAFWNQYVPIAAKTGQTERMLTLARAAAASPDVSESRKAFIHEVLFKALLASDNVDEGVQEMRRLMASTAGSNPLVTGYGVSSVSSKGELSIMLAQIGLLLQKPEWTQEGVDGAKAWLAQTSASPQTSWETGPVAASLQEILLQLNRGPEAEAVSKDALARAIRQEKRQPGYDDGMGGAARPILIQLTALYHSAGRENDVITLLEQSPNWGAKDLSELSESGMFDGEVAMMQLHTASSQLPIAYIAANALISVGRKEEATAIVDDLLNQKPGLDRGYELLLKLKGNDAIGRLDELFSRDQFEERPLIWKAHLLRQQNQLAAAEKIIRQAIAIDPSDGEEGRGDRMRAYAELADIREAQGDKKDADFYREIVKAIRISENADQFYTAGLLKRAVAMYEEGLTHFADAYCIQSRLAIQLAALGKNQEAEEHYRRAYELMPDSFGRVESHCFGCERAFDGERPQSIAEKVFTGLVAAHPEKPQVHYLLGYLREEQERFSEACTNYLEAVRLDPEYLNAWGRLQGISEHVHMAPKERDDIAFNILRLDPLQRHQHPNFNLVSDLAGLWNAMEAASRRYPASSSNLFTLTASRIAVEKKENDAAGAAMQMQVMQQMRIARRLGLTPASALGQTPFVQIAGQLMFSFSGAGDQ
jgi:tetratricopeptide (TPR) repeat protein